MSLTLLLDLDDTLLDSNMELFIPAYFQSLSEYMADLVSPKILLPALMAGTRSMMASLDPLNALDQVFYSEFFPPIALPPERLMPRIEQFYKDVFPELRNLTAPRPDVQEFVEWAFSQGFMVSIATNPLFPKAAIYHRLHWAGLPVDQFPFRVVSTFENFHFTKPTPEYYAEVLAQMGWPEGPVLLVGDDLENDISGASKLGLASFWISNGRHPSQEAQGFKASGSIGEVRRWLEELDQSLLEPDFSSPLALMAILRATPAAMHGIVLNIGLGNEHARPQDLEWSLTEIICHLRDTEIEFNLERISTILAEQDPFLPTQNTEFWSSERAYNIEDFSSALREFGLARIKTLEMLKWLTEAQWKRTARHAIFGPSTLYDIVNFMVEHDRLHIRQFIATLERVKNM